jgi:hypothetical protein
VIRIEVVTAGRSGFFVAVETTGQQPGTGYDWDAEGTAVVVGQLYRGSEDGFPERWTAWLWKQAGTYPARGTTSGSLNVAGPPSELARKLRKRHAANGAWWS